jgi:parvulin-like peptidyl-prolyl isomerase
MRFKLAIFAIFCLLFAGLLGCDKLNPKKAEPAKQAAPYQAAVKGTLIAKVNNMPVTLEELNQEIEAYNTMVPVDKPEMKITTREQRINYLKNEMVRRLLLYQQAQVKGLETKMDLLVVELIKEEAQNVEVTSKEIEDYYNTYKEQLKEPEERQVSEIVVPTEQEAKDIMIELLKGADFITLAKERSKAASAKNGGSLGVVQRGSKFIQFDNVAFSDSLEVGKFSNIFKGSDGYYVIKLDAKIGGKQKSLSEMWDDIKRGLTFLKQQQKVEDLIGKLSREAKIETYEGEIK